MAQQLFTNNANATLASGITSGVTSVVLTTGNGALLPNPSGGDWFIGTFVKNGNTAVYEIVKCTARSTDTLTIVRAQEGTTALSWNAGDSFSLLPTAGGFGQFIQLAYLLANYFTATTTSATFAPLASPVFTGDPVAPTAAPGTSTTQLATTAFVQTAIGNSGAPVGSFKNLRIGAAGNNTVVDVSVDEISLENGSNQYVVIRPATLPISTSASGANGLDTGSIVGSTWYSVWVIYNPGSVAAAGLLSLSSTSPTLPSGYTFSARVGWIRTDPVHAYPLAFQQFGRTVAYVVAPSTNVTTLPLAASGNNSITSLTAVSLAAFVPITTSKSRLIVQTFNGQTVCAPNSHYGGYNGGALSSTPPPPINVYGASGSAYQNMYGELTNETPGSSPTIYWGSDPLGGTYGAIYVYGWEDNL